MFVSCAFDEIYGEDDFAYASDRAGRGDELSHDAAAFGITLAARVFDESSYTWPDVDASFLQQDAFASQLLAFYGKISRHRTPAAVLVRIEQAYFRNFQVACGQRETAALIYETYRVPDHAVAPPLEPPAIVGCDESRFCDPDVDYMLLAGSGSFNYGHWLIDELPRIRAALDQIVLGGRPVRLLVASYGDIMDRVRADSIRYLTDDLRISVEFFDPATVYAVRNLYLMTFVSCHPMDKSPPAMQYLRRLGWQREVFARTGMPAPVARKLFIARSGGNGRSLIEVDAISAHLAEQGYITVDPSEMTFAEQVSTFAAADTIIGVMGASMTNTVFCRPGTRVTYLAPRGWIETFYIDLAAVCGHRYRVVYGTLQDPEQVPYFSPFSISDHELALVLSDLGSDQPAEMSANKKGLPSHGAF